jgi:class 3 adenylate cyclase
MSSFAEAFDSQVRVNRAIVAVDLSCSTAMKERDPESTWLTTYAWFFGLLQTSISETRGQIVKFLGDGAMAVFPDTDVHEAINWAIRVQERILEVKSNRVHSCDGCSFGIAYGEVVEFETPFGTKDYIGSVADRAFRLCSAANSMAVFVDTEMVMTAAMNRVTSQAGMVAPRRKAVEYRGVEQAIKAKGFKSPVPYHEIWWGKDLYGVSAPFVTDLSGQQPGPRSIPSDFRFSPPAAFKTGTRDVWVRGRVQSVNDVYGFVQAQAGEQFWFNSDHLFRRGQLPNRGEEVWFIPADPFPGKPNRRATDMIAFGALLDGVVEKLMPGGFGFVLCDTDSGERRQIFVLTRDTALERGMRVEFVVGENPKGLAGYEPRVLDADGPSRQGNAA